MPDDEPLNPTQREQRRRRLARIFGDVLPDQTGDDTDVVSEESVDPGEEWLRRQVPPHHG